ncbi:Catalase related subgroup domain protein [mine drainage metagenome]|uniref:Catalase related subgroup domain protein n=1 Tax=mine drainage metagenome TaxID=410659 RepID=T1C9B8_9ZZZZ
MNGYGGHTFKWVNENGDVVWVKYHFKTDSKIKNMDPKMLRELLELIQISIEKNFTKG